MRSWFSSIFRDLVGAAVFVAIVTILVPVLAWLQSLPWYVIALSAIGSFGLSFWGFNQFKAFQIRRKKGLAELGDKEIEETIRNWLDEPFFNFQRNVAPDCLFQFVVKDKPGRPVTVSRPNQKPTQLELATAITLSNEHRGKYEALSLGRKQEIMHDLRIEMARYGISYTGIDTKLERIVLSDIVLLDNSLTEFYLKQRVLFVIRAFTLYSEIISRQLMRLGEQESRKEGSQT